MRFIAFEYHKGTGHPEYDIPGPFQIVQIPWAVMEDAVCSRQEEADRVWSGPWAEEWDCRNGYIFGDIPIGA
jgi:hypothetical protein